MSAENSGTNGCIFSTEDPSFITLDFFRDFIFQTFVIKLSICSEKMRARGPLMMVMLLLNTGCILSLVNAQHSVDQIAERLHNLHPDHASQTQLDSQMQHNPFSKLSGRYLKEKFCNSESGICYYNAITGEFFPPPPAFFGSFGAEIDLLFTEGQIRSELASFTPPSFFTDEMPMLIHALI